MLISETNSLFAGVSSENRFFSPHCLADIFWVDIEHALDAWQQAETGRNCAPFNHFKDMRKDYFATRKRLTRAKGEKCRINLQRKLFRKILDNLGYIWAPQNLALDDKVEIPILARIGEKGKPPFLLVLGVNNPISEHADPLALHPLREQFHSKRPAAPEVLKETWSDIITKRIFAQSRPPRWVLLLSDAQLLLIDHNKWNQNCLLRFDWSKIFSHREDRTLKTTIALLHAHSLVPEMGIPLLDRLNENANKHVFATSEDLKYALRQAID